MGGFCVWSGMKKFIVNATTASRSEQMITRQPVCRAINATWRLDNIMPAKHPAEAVYMSACIILLSLGITEAFAFKYLMYLK
jgi:hypothetical protein